MGRRAYSRQPDGQFRRATLENTFGLSVEVCPECRIMNPYQAGAKPPDNCHACGAALRPVAECGRCGTKITLIRDRWTAEDGVTACTGDPASIAAHEPKAA